jgi:hypothetical protein
MLKARWSPIKHGCWGFPVDIPYPEDGDDDQNRTSQNFIQFIRYNICFMCTMTRVAFLRFVYPFRSRLVAISGSILIE